MRERGTRTLDPTMTEPATMKVGVSSSVIVARKRIRRMKLPKKHLLLPPKSLNPRKSRSLK